MRTVVVALLVSSLSLSACGSVRESRLNPFNWFGGSRELPAEEVQNATVNPLIPRKSGFFARKEVGYQGQILSQITDMKVERIEGGAIVRVAGIAQRADAYNVKLVQQEVKSDSALHYQLQAEFPRASKTTIQRTRPVTIAIYLTNQDLEGIRRIRVSASENSRESRR